MQGGADIPGVVAMNNRLHTILAVGACTTLAFSISVSFGQESGCSLGDVVCLEARITNECATDAPEGSCAAFAQETLSREDDPDSTLYAALAYYQLARMVESADESEAFDKRTIEIFEGIIEKWPSSHAASVAHLSLPADTLEERIALNRLALQADPSYSHAMENLAGALVRRGTNADFLEATQLMRAAYEHKPGFWYLAGRALSLYRQTLQFEEAAQFEAQIRQDSGFDEFKARLSTVGLRNSLEGFKESMDTVCHAYLVPILDESACVAGINVAIDEFDKAVDVRRRAALAELIGTSMVDLIRATDDGEGGSYREQVVALAEALVASDYATAEVYMYMSNRAPDAESRLAANARAVALAPENVSYRYRLALKYLELERFPEAAHHLRLLEGNRPLVPKEMFEENLRRAEERLSN